MASKRQQVKMKSSESSHVYMTSKNKTTHPERLKLTKFDPIVKKHVEFKEAK